MGLALFALALPAQPPLGVAFLGTSITCGAGAGGPFLPKVKAGLEKCFHREVETYGVRFGGANLPGSVSPCQIYGRSTRPFHPSNSNHSCAGHPLVTGRLRC